MTTNCSDTKGTGINVHRHVVAVTVADGDTVGSAKAWMNGIVYALCYDIAQCTGTTTVTCDIKDEDDTDWHTKASIAENAKTVEKLAADNRFPVAGTYTVELTQTNAQSGSAASHNVIIYFERK